MQQIAQWLEKLGLAVLRSSLPQQFRRLGDVGPERGASARVSG
jgi:hypothetical protein